MSSAESPTASLKDIAGQFRSEVFAYIRGRVGDSATADDLTQETFVKVGNALSEKELNLSISAAGFSKSRETPLSIF